MFRRRTIVNANKEEDANVGVTYVSDAFAGKAVLSYNARVLGQDAEAITKDNPGTIQIIGNVTGSEVKGNFYYGQLFSGTKKTKDTNSYVTVYVTIDNGSGSKIVYLD